MTLQLLCRLIVKMKKKKKAINLHNGRIDVTTGDGGSNNQHHVRDRDDRGNRCVRDQHREGEFAVAERAVPVPCDE